MSRPTPVNPDLLAKARIIIQRRPGITLESLGTAIGEPFSHQFRKGRPCQRPNAALKRAVAALKAEGYDLRQDAYATPRDPWKLYPPDYEPPRKRPLFQKAADSDRLKCRSYFVDPEEVARLAAVVPVRPPIADLPTESRWKSDRPNSLTEEVMSANLSKILEAIADAKRQAIANKTYAMPSRNHLAIVASVDSSFFYSNTRVAQIANEAYDAAVAELEQAKPTPDAPELEEVEPTPQPEPVAAQPDELQQLRDRLTEAERLREAAEERNRELRQQLAESAQPVATPPAPQIFEPLQWLDLQIEQWQQEVETITADLAAAQRKLNACQELRKLHEDPQDFASTPTSIAHVNSNGRH